MIAISALEELASRLNDKNSDCLDDVTDDFSDLVRADIHICLANHILESMLKGNHTALPSTNGKYILLYNKGSVSLAIVRYSKPSRDILWSSENFLQQSISLNSCETATYGIPINTREDQFNPHVAAFLLEKNALHFGDVMRKRPRDVIDIHKLDNGPIDFVRMSLPPRGYFEWAFSRESLAATSITTTRYGESNLLGILDLMAQAGNVRSEDILSRLVTHPLHFVRWRAVRSLVQLNADRGTHYLQIAVNDPHPEVKAAAIKSLELACSRLEERKVVS